MKIAKSTFLRYPMGRKFHRNNGYARLRQICVFPFWAKIQNGRHMWGGKFFLKIAKSTFLRYPWVENFDEIALSRTVKEIEAILCFAILGKNSKIQNGRHMWEEEIF